jgi:hypothetical protein
MYLHVTSSYRILLIRKVGCTWYNIDDESIEKEGQLIRSWADNEQCVHSKFPSLVPDVQDVWFHTAMFLSLGDYRIVGEEAASGGVLTARGDVLHAVYEYLSGLEAMSTCTAHPTRSCNGSLCAFE